MKNLVPKISCAFIAIALLAGCQSADQKDSKLTVPTRVALLLSPPQKPYTIIGHVATPRPHQDPRLGYDSSQTWQNELQKQAAASGADAVIVDMATVNNSYAVLITGNAIRYQHDAAPAAK